MPTYDMTTFGETMLRLSVPAGRRLECAATLDVHLGGAESNVATLLARLGRPTAWSGALPESPLGRLVAAALRSAGVDVGNIHWHPTARMGTYYVEFSAPPRPIQVLYDRAHSAAAQMMADDLAWDTLLDTRLLHLTGITPALAPGCLAAVTAARQRAGEAGIPVSFDVNFRSKLWSPTAAAAALSPLLDGVALLFCGRGDAELLFGLRGEPVEIVAQLAERFRAQTVIMSVGDAGVLAWQDGRLWQSAALPVQILDRLGAGDALAAGVIDGWLRGDLAYGVQLGAVLAALALSQEGDMVVTTRQEAEGLMGTRSGAGIRR